VKEQFQQNGDTMDRERAACMLAGRLFGWLQTMIEFVPMYKIWVQYQPAIDFWSNA
jgi:hypothetical protein